MKRILLSLVVSIAAWAAQAQTVPVTFKVDMKNEVVSTDGVHVAGSFQAAAGFPGDWQPNTTALTDSDNDKIYEVTVQLPAGSYQFKFVNGNAWGKDEGVPAACAVSNNREVVVGASAATYGPVCYASCIPCASTVDTLSVTFSVDMTNEKLEGRFSGDTVWVAGDLQGKIKGGTSGNWTPGATYLLDTNNDNVFEGTYMLPEGSYAYKFLRGKSWGTDEGVPAACASGGNRSVTVDGAANGSQVVATTCFGECGQVCSPLPPKINVTFRMDLDGAIPSTEGIHVAGEFQYPVWQKSLDEMSDADNNGIYNITLNFRAKQYAYKFFNGDGANPAPGDIEEENINFFAAGCGLDDFGKNRLLNLVGITNDTILPVYKFNKCDVVLAGSTGIKANAILGYTLAPNPFSSYTVLSLPVSGTFTVKMLDARGNVVNLFQNAAGEVRIARQSLNSGIYLLHITDASGNRATEKLVIE